MKIGSMGFIVFLLLNFWGNAIHSQELDRDLLKTVAFYKDAQYLSADIAVEVYNSEGGAPTIRKNALLRKKDNRFYYKLDEMEMLVNPKNMIMVYHASKKVLYKKLKPKEWNDIFAQSASLQIDTLTIRCDSVRYRGVEGQNKHYSVFTNKKAIQRTELYLEKSNLGISKMIYYYNPKYYKESFKVIVRFEKVNTLDAAPESTFASSNYLVAQGNELKLSPSLASYKLIVVDKPRKR